MTTSTPPCRADQTAADRAREADRSVLYGAILRAQRPTVAIKPAIAAAVAEIQPAVTAYLQGLDDDLAAEALDYARACHAEEFLVAKRAAIEERR